MGFENRKKREQWIAAIPKKRLSFVRSFESAAASKKTESSIARRAFAAEREREKKIAARGTTYLLLNGILLVEWAQLNFLCVVFSQPQKTPTPNIDRNNCRAIVFRRHQHDRRYYFFWTTQRRLLSNRTNWKECRACRFLPPPFVESPRKRPNSNKSTMSKRSWLVIR